MLTLPSDSANHRKDLIEQLARGRVIVVAGTGVSIAATKSSEHPFGHPQASWPGLLEHGLDFIVRNGLASDSDMEPLRLAIQTGDVDNLIFAATVVSRKISAPTSNYYKQWLSETVGSIKAKDLRLLNSLQRLRQTNNILATTNYDDLLVEGQPDLQPVTWDDRFELLRVARGGSHGVLFLHGHWRQEKTVILDWQSYLTLAQHAEARSDLEAVWKMTTWLYVGCGHGGLSDPDLGKLIDQFGPSAKNAELWDYFLATEAETGLFEDFFRKRGVNIRVLTYGTTHDDLPGFLERLADESVPQRLGVRSSALLVELAPITSGFRDFRQPGEDVSASFRPSFEEFQSGLVHRPKTVDQVVAALSGRNWAWLRGVSATGKTTIALHVALETSSADLPALYLDLSDEPDISAVAREISAASAPGRLFVIDNVHVNPRGAAALLGNWEQNANGSRMLLLSWPLDEHRQKRQLVAYNPGALEVSVTEEDIEGVYLTLRRRLRSLETSVPKPPRAAVRQWFTQFSADLVAFQLAVAASLRTVTTDWNLGAEPAQRYLREKYLENCSPEERSDMIRLALFSELGLSLPEECLKARLERALSAGIVRKSAHGRFGQFVRFRLWHQSLGRSLLAANPDPVDRPKEFSQVSITSPTLGTFLGERLWHAGEEELARRVLRLSISATGGILRAFGDNLNLAARYLRILNTSGVLRFAEASSSLTAKVVFEDLEKLALATQLDVLVNFLNFVRTHLELRPVYELLSQSLVAEAAKPADENQLLAQMFATPPVVFGKILGFFGKHSEFGPVYDSLIEPLIAETAKPAAEGRLLAQILATPLHFLAAFLGLAGNKPELEPIYASLVQALVAESAKPATENQLVAQMLGTPLGDLASFLGFLGKPPELKPVYESLIQALITEAAKPAAESRFLAHALTAPLDSLTHFLNFIDSHGEFGPLYDALAHALVAETTKPAAENRLLAQTLATPLGALAKFVEFVAKRDDLKPVFESLSQLLITETAKSAAENRLLTQALAAPLDSVAYFLELVASQPELQPVWESLAREFADEAAKPASENKVLALALAASLENAAGFLAVCANHQELKRLHSELKPLLLARADLIGRKILRTRFAQTLSLLSLEPQLAKEALSRLTTEEWIHSFDSMAEAPVLGVGRFLAKLSAFEFSERANATAGVLVQRAQPKDWDNPRIGIFDLSVTLRYAKVDANEKMRLVETVATPRWLTNRYRQESVGPLAGGLFLLAAHQPASLFEHFNRESLARRVSQGLFSLRTLDPKDAGQLLELWAGAELLGAWVFVKNARWPGSSLAQELVEVHFTNPVDIDGLGYIEQQLWMGLRLLARHDPKKIPMKLSILEETLARWRKTAEDPERVETQKGWDTGMIRWLERCLRDSVLVRDKRPLREVLAPRVTNLPARTREPRLTYRMQIKPND